MTKPRDSLGNDLIVSATATAIQVARAAGLEKDEEIIRKLSNGFYSQELKRRKNDQNSMPE